MCYSTITDFIVSLQEYTKTFALFHYHIVEFLTATNKLSDFRNLTFCVIKSHYCFWCPVNNSAAFWHNQGHGLSLKKSTNTNASFHYHIIYHIIKGFHEHCIFHQSIRWHSQGYVLLLMYYSNITYTYRYKQIT